MMKIFVVIAACTVCKSTSAEPKPKIVGGRVAARTEVPFLVSLMFCSDSQALPSSCYSACSGSLIAPNVVMTAAHCVRPRIALYKDESLSPDISNMYVLIGSDNASPSRISHGGFLVKVTNVKYGSYNENVLFPIDGDIALLELLECVTVRPGLVEFAKIATKESEPHAGDCSYAQTAGYGQMSGAPSPFQNFDGAARIMTDHIHSSNTCILAYIALAQNNVRPVLQNVDFGDQYTILPENFICKGGDNWDSVCFGDSGGPTFVYVNGSYQVIGITSFGFNQPICSVGPDFSTRVAFRATWIEEQLRTNFTMCPGWNIENSFASWPVSDWGPLSTAYNQSRCQAGQWQCLNGDCINSTLVCDGQQDCADSSDEYLYNSKSGAYYCNVTGVNFTLPGSLVEYIPTTTLRLERQDAKSTVKLPQRTPKGRISSEKITCEQAASDVSAALAAYGSLTTITENWDASSILNACDLFYSCVNPNLDHPSFVETNDACSDIENYVAFTKWAIDSASSFSALFNASCPTSSSSEIPYSATIIISMMMSLILL
jgi:secreted trypsin-like serine protease